MMGMHVTLILASAMSRTRRFILYDIVTFTSLLLSLVKWRHARQLSVCTHLLSSSSVMAPQGQASHVITTIFLLPSRTLLLSNPLRAHHSASFMLKPRESRDTALDACTSQSAEEDVKERGGDAGLRLPGRAALAAL